jgi:hypothetical protein
MDDGYDKPSRERETKHERKRKLGREYRKKNSPIFESSEGRRPVEQPRKSKDWLRDSEWELDDI